MYNLGDRSLIFKYISKNLNNLYDSTIAISDEYTLDLAKSIYNFLNDKFPAQEIDCLSDGTAISDSIADYYLTGNPYVEIMSQKTVDVDYFYYDGKLSFLPTSSPNDNSLIYVYYSNNDIEQFKVYTYNSNSPEIVITDNPKTLNLVGVIDFTLLGYIANPYTYSTNFLGAKIYPTVNVSNYTANIIYDTNKDIIPFSIDDINKYNVKNWPIDNQVLQYLHPGIVVCAEFSSIDEIAIIQRQMIDARYLQYTPHRLGEIDSEFTRNCYLAQRDYSKNKDVLATGYFDTYVEAFIRHLSEVHK